MNIAVVTSHLNLQTGGGSNYSVTSIANQLSKRGNNVVLAPVELTSKNNISGFEFDVCEIGTTDNSNVKNMATVYSWIKNNSQFDIVYIYGPHFIPAGGLYRLRGGKTPIIGVLNSYFFCTNYEKMTNNCHKNCSIIKKASHSPRTGIQNILSTPYYFFNRFGFHQLCNMVDRILAISPAVKDRYVDIGIDEDIIEIVPLFYEQKIEHKFKKSNKDMYNILYVGRLEPFKNVDILLDAYEKSNIFNCQLDVVGDGTSYEFLRNKADSISKPINFHGYVEHSKIGGWYNQSDVFVHPTSLPEPFGRTVLESLQCNTVPIVSNIGAPPWIVGDSGVLFTPDNVDSLKDQIEKLSDPHERSNFLNKREEQLIKFSPKKFNESVGVLHSEIVK